MAYYDRRSREIRELLNLAMKIEGPRAENVGTHTPAAVVIADKPLAEYVHLTRPRGKQT